VLPEKTSVRRPHHHHGHAHAHRTLSSAAIATIVFAIAEALGGWWTGSLALISDAGHMFTDAGALVLGAFAAWVARRPPSQRHSYGLGRAEVVAALVNATVMLLIVIALGYESFSRLKDPSPVNGIAAGLIAAAGLAVNLWVLRVLAPHGHDLNTRAARLHVLGDVLGSVAALASGAIIVATGWTTSDAIASLAICVLIAVSALRLMRESLHALMEGVPHGLSVEAIAAEMVRIEGVLSVHDLHVWLLSGSRTALSAHVVIRSMAQWDTILARLQERLHLKFGIDHVTLQAESSIRPLVRH
jgi:cobalt-zinc-cadmium efflux system protein